MKDDGTAARETPLSLGALGALGVVYGDIGTSPLYALREAFAGDWAVPPAPPNVLGVLSLVLWSLILVVSVKYVLVVLRADNGGEGGLLALMTLVLGSRRIEPRGRAALTVIGLFGAGLLYGDGVITPAISVLSALEGLAIPAPALKPAVVPVSLAILIVLFAVQSRGTGALSQVFGPVMLLWFATIAFVGVLQIVAAPEVLGAANPLQALAYFARHGVAGFLVLGAVFLVVTGGEALYADMGHFGRRPIQTAWFFVALPALVLNYYGQGALLLRHPEAATNPFYLSVPEIARLPTVGLATVATIIASQAVISGAFSLTGQALQLGYIPRLEIRHSSEREAGQIYVPLVNWVLLAVTIVLVLTFRTSGQLAGAYGMAVSTTMVVTTVLLFLLFRWRWGWSLGFSAAATVPMIVVDIAFLSANLDKIKDGGWLSLGIGVAVCVVMTTWRRGRQLLADAYLDSRLPTEMFVADLRESPPIRKPGLGVFLDTNPRGMPRTLLHNLKHNGVLQDRVILLTVTTDDVPRVSSAERIELRWVGPDMIRVIAHYGFMETPNVPLVVSSAARRCCWPYEPAQTTYFLGRESLLMTGPGRMAKWRKQLFRLLSRNAEQAGHHMRIPVDRVIEIGAHVEL